jgi:Ca2+-binding RTX toxin-like protein
MIIKRIGDLFGRRIQSYEESTQYEIEREIEYGQSPLRSINISNALSILTVNTKEKLIFDVTFVSENIVDILVTLAGSSFEVQSYDLSGSRSWKTITLTETGDSGATVSFSLPNNSSLAPISDINDTQDFENDINNSGVYIMRSYRAESDSEIIVGSNDAEEIYAEKGDDIINGLAGDDILRGGGGNDIISGGLGDDTIYGEEIYDESAAGDDTIYGGSGNDIIEGRLGDDKVHGGLGNDFLEGNDGSDFITGGLGDDTIYGESYYDYHNIPTGSTPLGGNDIIIAGWGQDHVYGDRGNDIIYAGPGDDFIDGGEGNDIIIGGAGDDHILGDGDSPFEELYGNDILIGGSGNDSIEGNLGDDIIKGGSGDDILGGGDGNDLLIGGQGDDTLIGDSGADVIFTGSGSDIILYYSLSYSTSTDRDVIMDFEQGMDIIEFRNGRFQGMYEFSDLTVINDGSNTIVSANQNDFEVELLGVLDLVDADFVF